MYTCTHTHITWSWVYTLIGSGRNYNSFTVSLQITATTTLMEGGMTHAIHRHNGVSCTTSSVHDDTCSEGRDSCM